MQKLVVGIKFRSSGKIYFFNPKKLELEVGDDVVVDSAVGLSYGQVALKTYIPKDQIEEPLKDVLRKATQKDKETYQELKERALKDRILVKEKVKQLELEMKIVSVEYCLDASKVVIEFSAEDRVDFRELLKELASALKVRIELHQVGQRDEVKIIGGLGPCGEECCCVRFLKEFEHVTVKMAKNQGLSLSPTKISGLCGRLMCCLGYENKAYEEVLKRMPKLNSKLQTSKGFGQVVYNDILRERVSVKVQTGEDSFTIYDFALEELLEDQQVNKTEQVQNQPAPVAQEQVEKHVEKEQNQNKSQNQKNNKKFKNKKQKQNNK